jgi:hypothetical protein
MKTPSLGAVGGRLLEAYKLLPDEPDNPEEAFQRFESICIAVLDSEHSDFISGELQEYLENKLYEFRLVHHLVPFPDPREE